MRKTQENFMREQKTLNKSLCVLLLPFPFLPFSFHILLELQFWFMIKMTFIYNVTKPSGWVKAWWLVYHVNAIYWHLKKLIAFCRYSIEYYDRATFLPIVHERLSFAYSTGHNIERTLLLSFVHNITLAVAFFVNFSCHHFLITWPDCSSQFELMTH